MKHHEHSEKPRSVRGSLAAPPVPKDKKPATPQAERGKSFPKTAQTQGHTKGRFVK